MTRSIRLSLSLALFVAACAENPDSQIDTAIIGGRPDIRVDTGRFNASKPAAVIPARSSTPSRAIMAEWTVTEFGFGALRAGMTVAVAAKIVGGSFSAPAGGAK